MSEFSDSIETLQELSLLHEGDPTLHLRLADELWKSGKEIAALAEARKSYAILKQENPMEAAEVVARFGNEITIDEKFPPAAKTYLPLADFFKKKIKKHSVKLKKGSLVFTRGDAGNFLYLLLDGEVAITAEENGIHAMVNYLHSGCLFGRCSLTEAKKHNVSAVAAKDSIVLMFTAQELKKAFAKLPDLEIQFSKECLIRSRVELLSATPAMSRVPMGLRFLLAKRSWTVQYQAGDVMKAKGEAMSEVAFILSGVVELSDEHSDDSSIYCGRMKQGEALGIQSLMHKEALSLVIKAKTACEVLCLSFADIEDLMDLQPQVRKVLTDAAVTFSQQMTRTILLQKKMGV